MAENREINPRGCSCGRSRGRSRGATRGPIPGATHGSNLAFACSVRHPLDVQSISRIATPSVRLGPFIFSEVAFSLTNQNPELVMKSPPAVLKVLLK